MRELTLEEFKARDLELMKTRDKDAELPDLPEKAWLYVQRTALANVTSMRESLERHERDLESIPGLRSMLDDALYVSGHSDTHPAIHGSTMTIPAVELSGRHLGMEARSIWYRDNRPGTAASPEETYPLLSIHYLRNGNVLINDSFVHLRPDTEVTLILPPAVREA
ncbi:hypothetical protein [Arthrobacter sp. zg-Y1110]|uniref:hypothetical protein n=1 Tax=Arthrobacter sp. zg-Y1110 TaxID=2886932 RepID=UPI001D1598C2|nr:hypothetical protein [Arthrobacter sp. zg-Y1110]MCC3292927.1 hypothetical protein [Arthrobacter sp. zg-Y1110]UWX86866.1 hypothetical protein N2K99_18660 [Arthrobacter sp. zg-Y1110]